MVLDAVSRSKTKGITVRAGLILTNGMIGILAKVWAMGSMWMPMPSSKMYGNRVGALRTERSGHRMPIYEAGNACYPVCFIIGGIWVPTTGRNFCDDKPEYGW